jgi:hypothetical protein
MIAGIKWKMFKIEKEKKIITILLLMAEAIDDR